MSPEIAPAVSPHPHHSTESSYDSIAHSLGSRRVWVSTMPLLHPGCCCSFEMMTSPRRYQAGAPVLRLRKLPFPCGGHTPFTDPLPAPLVLQVILLVHWLLTTWGCIGFSGSYAWANFTILALGVWAVAQRDSVDAISMTQGGAQQCPRWATPPGGLTSDSFFITVIERPTRTIRGEVLGGSRFQRPQSISGAGGEAGHGEGCGGGKQRDSTHQGQNKYPRAMPPMPTPSCHTLGPPVTTLGVSALIG
ncbi:type-1 angiotensin II receptor-associated protein isoform X1 [Marmota marmota marmota]|uniref:type-1 angiotensin II receptor-associated protein isoform X1 n=1 Tax=Marmota marmota marmota TaxID=9994 RepID=UPI00209266B7|nr:type-1 angiotensin II receptor-associated protein isoform X1 [Marmota marmota marmota]